MGLTVAMIAGATAASPLDRPSPLASYVDHARVLVISAPAPFQTIDAMPMRREEMRRTGSQ